MIQYVADRQALYMQAKQPRSDILYMTTLDTGRCSHNVLRSELNARSIWVHEAAGSVVCLRFDVEVCSRYLIHSL